ncbi:MAG: phospholipid carrier-dependent glycosyltransferase [Bacteroidota bacterium]|nr:phospholipid carrier-dependent glycosyltransferase [Bacteroidota bacterium]MDW8138486.1 phospholipid carrier-dependent glycosyltransferase [Bacteroidota bacterium]
MRSRMGLGLGLGLGALIAGGVALRWVFLDADPPWLLDRGFITDELWWAHQGRNYALFGRWHVDGFYQAWVSAWLFTVLQGFIFCWLGVSIETMRLLSALSGTLTLPVVYALFYDRKRPEVALYTVALYAISAGPLLYSRVGFVESTLVLSLLLSLLAWRYRWFFLSGFFLGITALIKTSAFYFFPIYALLLAWEAYRGRWSWGSVLRFVAGGALVAIPYVAFLVHPDYSGWIAKNRSSAPIYIRPYFWLNLWINSFIGLIPAVAFVALWHLVPLLRRLLERFRSTLAQLDEPDALALILLAGNIVLLATSSYQPERRFLPVFPALAYLAALWLAGWRWRWPEPSPQAASPWGRLLRWLGALWLPWSALHGVGLAIGERLPIHVGQEHGLNVIGISMLSFAGYLAHAGWMSFIRSREPDLPDWQWARLSALVLVGMPLAVYAVRFAHGPSWIASALVGGLGLGLAWALRRQEARFERGLERLRMGAAALLLLVLVELPYLSSWLPPSYAFRDAGRQIRALVGDQPVVAHYNLPLAETRAPVIRPSIRYNYAPAIFHRGYALVLRYDRDFSVPRWSQIRSWPPVNRRDPTLAGRAPTVVPYGRQPDWNQVEPAIIAPEVGQYLVFLPKGSRLLRSFPLYVYGLPGYPRFVLELWQLPKTT